jgi:hypothetical protein
VGSCLDGQFAGDKILQFGSRDPGIDARCGPVGAIVQGARLAQ